MSLGLVRSLFTWLPRNATWVGVVAGPLAVLGYLVGSIPFAYFLSRRRLRRQLDDPRLRGLRSRHPAREDDPLDRPGVIAAGALAGLVALAVATVAWDVALAATPGASDFSAIGTFSDQAVGAWVSVALWTGAAAVLGHLAPPWSGFRGGTGTPPAVALAFAYAPLAFGVGALVFLAVVVTARSTRVALLACLPFVVATAYVGWLADLQGTWGVTMGPELTLWVTALAVTLFAGNASPRTAG